jgi:hypothetical protein
VAGIARSFKEDGSQYFVLLIITDGIITDIRQTKAAIVAASDLPLSIIIVGVGDADFEAMKELDGDEVRLTSPDDGKAAVRDIVQFVAFRNFLREGFNNPETSRLRLAKEVLAEVPDQFLGYMTANRIVPKQQGDRNGSRILPSDPEVLLHF